MIFIIDGTLPSLNEMITTAKKSKYAYAEMAEVAKNKVSWSAIRDLGRIKLEPSDYRMMWYCPNKRKDKDNVIAGQKYIFDGLQEAGFLKNDGWSQIGRITHDFDVDAAYPRIEVYITEVSK